MKSFKEFLTEEITFDKPGFHTFKHGKATIQYGVPRKESQHKHIELTSIRVPQKHRKQGHADAAMNEFVKKLDAEGRDSKLAASPLDNKSPSSKRLMQFYSKHGYEETDEKVNYQGDKFMFRKHKK